MGRSSMTGLMLGGAVFALIGLIGFAIPYFTTHQAKDVATIGDLKVQTTESRTYAVPPLVSGGALALGVVLIGAGFYRKA
jgi:hypothetical protein